jgi:hypothetical protein
MKPIFRVAIVVASVAGVTFLLPRHSGDGDHVLAAGRPEVTLSIQNAIPRQVEDTTEKAVARDYAAAWQALADALEQNRPDLLGAIFVGTAGKKLGETISEQRKAGLHQRLQDKGHHVNAIFYSPEGSAIELQDTAELQIQVLDGDKVLHSEAVTLHYVALLTAAENSWKVRVLEAVPTF